MKYHGGSRFGLSEKEQSLIYWSCQNLERLSPRKKEALEKIIEECADGEEDALREALCTGKSLTKIAIRRFTSESALQRRCEKFYQKAKRVVL